MAVPKGGGGGKGRRMVARPRASLAGGGSAATAERLPREARAQRLVDRLRNRVHSAEVAKRQLIHADSRGTLVQLDAGGRQQLAAINRRIDRGNNHLDVAERILRRAKAGK